MLFTHDDESAASDAVMRAMFEARKRVFVDLLGWDLPVLAGLYEVDQYDDAHARYLILTDTDQNHLASNIARITASLAALSSSCVNSISGLPWSWRPDAVPGGRCWPFPRNGEFQRIIASVKVSAPS